MRLPGTIGRLLAAGAIAWSVSAAEPETNPAQQQMQAYMALLRADDFRDAESWGEAVDGYRAALEQYRALAELYPDRQSEIIQYRIRYCEGELEDVSARVPVEVAAEPTAVEQALLPDPPSPEMDRQRVETLTRENQYLLQRIAELEQELDGGDAAGEALRQRLEASQRELIDLRETTDRLQARVDIQTTELKTLREQEGRNRELEGYLEEAKTRLTHQAQTLHGLRDAESELRKAQEELAARRTQVRHLQLALRGAEQESIVLEEMEEEKRTLELKVKLLVEERQAAATKVREAVKELTSLRKDREELLAARGRAENALAKSLAEAQEFVRRGKELEERAAGADRALRELESAVASEREALQQQVAATSTQRDALIEDVARIKAERDEALKKAEEIEQLEKELDAATAARIELESRAAGAEADALRAKAAQEALDDLRGTLGAMESDFAKQKETIRLQQEELAELKERVREGAETEQALNDLREEYSLLRDDFVRQQDEITRMAEQAGAEKAELERLREMREELQRQDLAAQERPAMVVNESDELGADMLMADLRSEVQTERSRAEEGEKALGDLRLEYDLLQAELEEARMEVSASWERIQALEDQTKLQASGELNEIRNEWAARLESASQEIKDLRARLDAVTAELESEKAGRMVEQEELEKLRVRTSRVKIR